MKLKIYLIVIIAFAITTFGTAQTYVSNYTITGNQHYRYQTNFTNFDVQVDGDITVNDNDTGIKSISPGGFLKISMKSFGNRRALEIHSNSDGLLSYEYTEGRKEEPFEPEGRKWLAEILPDVVRSTGIDAVGRTKRIYKKVVLMGS